MSEDKKPFVRKVSEAERAEIRREHDAWLRTIMIGAIDGALIGIAVGVAIIGLDINGIGAMLSRSSNQIGYTFMLLAGLAHTFGMVVAGMSIWLKSTEDE